MEHPSLDRFAEGSSAVDVLAGQAEIVDAVLAASRVFVAVASEALAGSSPDVTIPQFRALVLLEARKAMTIAELAEALGVVPSTATRMCDRLVAKRLVTRATDRTNRRQVTVSLRPEGRALIAESTRRRKERISELLTSIPPQDQVELAAALRLLVQAAAR
ncbi:MAG TPA: MarR family transcriptional regulator [Jatrophihabitans sp.]|nr:MarR family transcriptional regulator [Jatrophihabitans sp.]